MKRLPPLALALATLGVAWWLAWQPASAESPMQGCQSSDVGRLHTTQRVWDDDMNSWVLADFQCSSREADGSNPFWVRSQIRHIFNTTDKPNAVVRFTGFDRDGWPQYQSVGSTESLAEPPVGTTYWDTAVSQTIQRTTSQYVDAATICTQLKAGGREPSQIYRVGGAWHHIESAGHRSAFGRPDARMSSIWRSVPACR